MGWQLPWNERLCVRCQKDLQPNWEECPYCGAQQGAAHGTQGASLPKPTSDGSAGSSGLPRLYPKTEPLPPHLQDAPIQAVSDGNIGWLVPLDGPNTGKLFEVGQRALLGAAEDCTHRLDDPAIVAAGRKVSVFAV